MDAYFILDDWCNELNREGFVVMFGNPQTAIGTQQNVFITLTAATRWTAGHTVDGELIYRVRLARRHGTHSVRPLKVPDFMRRCTPPVEHAA